MTVINRAYFFNRMPFVEVFRNILFKLLAFTSFTVIIFISLIQKIKG